MRYFKIGGIALAAVAMTMIAVAVAPVAYLLMKRPA